MSTLTKASDYLDPASKPFSFCPGCSHGIVLDQLAAALEKLQIPPREVVVVTDIGCIGISDRHFNTHTFHGLHGRSITYATGLKLARPELHVVVLVGDGGLGIGGHHFLHAARRNLDITVLVCNNFNFGMTGGQHSVTTPHEGITATTTAGNFEYPLDVCGLVDVAQGNFAARAIFSDKELPDLIAAAIQSPGFAAVEVWEMCTAYFAKRNRLTPKAMGEQLAARNLGTGILVRREQEGYVAQMAAGTERLAREKPDRGMPIEAVFERPFAGRKTLLLAGRAGQKVRSSAVLLGRAAALCDLHATQRDDYPVTVMTGHSLAEMIFQSEPINALGVDDPDVVVVTAPEGKARIADRLRRLPADRVVYALPELLPLETEARVETIPVGDFPWARQKTQLVLGCVAYVAREAGLLPLTALRRAADLEGRRGIADANLATLDSLLAEPTS